MENDELERTKKREPGKITRAIKIALVGDGTVGTISFPSFASSIVLNGSIERKNVHVDELRLSSVHGRLHSNDV